MRLSVFLLLAVLTVLALAACTTATGKNVQHNPALGYRFDAPAES